LTENCAYNIGFFYHAFYFKSGMHNVLYRKCL
jgi:hypothetical protein